MRKKVDRDGEEAPLLEQAAGLIWARPERQRRERPALSREDIIRVALELADTEGIEAISIRRIAARLDVSAMALYWHIDRKEDVFELMVDRVYGEIPLPLPIATDWRTALRDVAIQTRAMMRRHPWITSLIGHRAMLGPNALKKSDYLLRVVGQLDMDVTTNMGILAMFNAYIVGFVLEELGEVEMQRRTGLTELEWQQQISPYVQEQIIASGRYPHLAYALTEGEDRSADEIFLFGLTRILDGIATHLER